MASYPGTRFPGPMFNQNFPPNVNYNMNPGMNRPPVPPFQRPPNIPFRPFQAPERFMQGIPNRPQFSNFPDTMGGSFLNRPPPPLPPAPLQRNQGFRLNSPPPVPRPRFPGPFERPFRPFNQMPTFGSPRSPFQSRPVQSVPSNHPKNLPRHTNKRRKQKPREFRKLKDDSTEKPFSCDTCDRAFVTQNELKEHNSQHIECEHENCTFQAHPKIVALHQKMQHDTGYADRINKLKDAAEIKKWREERKRRFPTVENIKKRKAEQLEKEARGEVLETKEFGKFKQGRQDVTRNHTTNRGKRFRGRHMNRTYDRRNMHPACRPFIIKVDSDSDSDSDSHITLKMFQGMSSLTNSARINCDENYYEAAAKKHKLSSRCSVEQNLPKSNTVCHSSISRSDVSCNGSNSTFVPTRTSFHMNSEKLKDHQFKDKSPVPDHTSSIPNFKDYEEPANESICEIPDNNIGETPEVFQIEDSDDEGPVPEPIAKSKEIINLDSDEHPVVELIGKSAKVVHSKILPSITKTPEIPETGHQSVNDVRNKNNWKNQTSKCNGFFEKQNSVPHSRKTSLLEKLLADDIRHERNVILQCIRHVVNNNFFGIGAKKL